jgi:hypothetical protein
MITGMTNWNSSNQSCCMQQPQCPDKFGCPPGVCPDFEIRRHDTKPPYRISISDCNGPFDLTGTIVEVSMWAIAKFKKAVLVTDTYFALADDVGFNQASIGDIIVVDRIRNPEQMLITGFDETNRFVQVQRGYNGTDAGDYKKGQKMRIFRILNAIADTNTVTEDVTNVNDGTITYGVVTDSQLIYNWVSQDTCLPGCYWLEFKLLKMLVPSSLSFSQAPLDFPLFGTPSLGMCSTSVIPIVPSFITSVSGCDLGSGVEWVRRFPLDAEGFLIKIVDSPTAENLI